MSDPRDEIKSDILRIKEFSLIFAQIQLFLITGYIDIVDEKGPDILRLIVNTLKNPLCYSIIHILFVCFLIILLILTPGVMLLSSFYLFRIVLKKYVFFSLSSGIESLREINEKYENALKMAVASIGVYILSYLLLKIFL